MGITRRQLKSFGATDYLIKRLTRSLQPADKQGRAYVYDTAQVIHEIHNLLETPRIRQTTKAVLTHLEARLSELVEELPHSKADRLLATIQQAEEANVRFEQTAYEARKVGRSFQNHKNQRNLSFNPRNNIVAFTF